VAVEGLRLFVLGMDQQGPDPPAGRDLDEAHRRLWEEATRRSEHPDDDPAERWRATEPNHLRDWLALVDEAAEAGDSWAAPALSQNPAGVDPVTNEAWDEGVASRPPRANTGGRVSDTRATRLVNMATEQFDLGWDLDGRPFAVERDGPNVALSLRGRGGLRVALAHAYFVAEGQAPGQNPLSETLAVIEGMATMGPRQLVAVRMGPGRGRDRPGTRRR